LDLIKKYNARALTPVEEHGVLFKRDDLFVPFSDSKLCGGKARQAIYLFNDNYKHIKENCNNTVATASSVKSPQLFIIAKLSKLINANFICAIGTHATLEKTTEVNKMVSMSRELGADIRIVSKMSYNNVLYSKLNEMQETEPHFNVGFGINLKENFNAIVGSVADQVQNLPKDLNNLIIPVGSAVTMTGILVGLQKYNINPKRVIGIQTAGFDRTKDIDNALPFEYKDVKYEFIIDKTYKYAKRLKKVIEGTDIQLSPIYESKAYEYAVKNDLLKTNKDLFWIVGNEDTILE